MKRWVLAAAIAWGLIVGGFETATAQVADTTKPGAESEAALITPATIDEGRKLFHGRGTCSACHGDKLQGGPIAPALVGPKWRHIDGTLAAIINRIDVGMPGTVMMPHPGRITEAQVHLVASYIYSVSHGKATP